MATDLTPFASADRIEARQLAVQQGAASLLQQSNQEGRFINAPAEAMAGMAIAARARSALGVAASVSADRIASSLSDLRAVRIDVQALDEIHKDAQRAFAETQIKHGPTYQNSRREFIDARMGRLAFELANPKAALLKAGALRVTITTSVVASFEIPAGAYLLSQTTSFPGGWVGGGIAAAVMFFTNIKLGRAAGVMAGRHWSSMRLKVLALVGVGGVAASAGFANIALGCLRAELPIKLGSINILAGDALQHISAWTLIGMESAIFVAALGWAVARERGGDNAHYRRLCDREAAKKTALDESRKEFLADLDEESEIHLSDVDVTEGNAEDAMTDAAAIYTGMHAERRTLGHTHAEIVHESAAIFRDIYGLAASQYHGPGPVRSPDFEREFYQLIAQPLVGVADVALARRVFKGLRRDCRTMREGANSSRALIADTRLEALRPIYTAT